MSVIYYIYELPPLPPLLHPAHDPPLDHISARQENLNIGFAVSFKYEQQCRICCSGGVELAIASPPYLDQTHLHLHIVISLPVISTYYQKKIAFKY